MMEKLDKIENVEEIELEFAQLEEDVSLSGDDIDQLTGKKGGRVVGFGCDD